MHVIGCVSCLFCSVLSLAISACSSRDGRRFSQVRGPTIDGSTDEDLCRLQLAIYIHDICHKGSGEEGKKKGKAQEEAERLVRLCALALE